MKQRFFFVVFFLLLSVCVWADSAWKILSITHNSDRTYTVTYQMVSGRIVSERLTKDQLDELRDDINEYNDVFYTHDYYVGPILPPAQGPRIDTVYEHRNDAREHVKDNIDKRDTRKHVKESGNKGKKQEKRKDTKERKKRSKEERKKDKDDFRMYYKNFPSNHYTIKFPKANYIIIHQ